MVERAVHIGEARGSIPLEPTKSNSMKTPEQMDISPEQPYDRSNWEKLKKRGSAFAIIEGRKLGVPREELNRFAEEIIEKAIGNQEYAFVYRFMTSMGIGTRETAINIGKQAFDLFMAHKEYSLAAAVAEDVWGRDSEEWKRADQASEAVWKKTEERIKKKEEKMEKGEWELSATISKDATFADLFAVIDTVEGKEGIGELNFEEELWDNFNPDIVEEIIELRSSQEDKAATIKVLDFFKERGYSQKDVSVLLPIKFKRE